MKKINGKAEWSEIDVLENGDILAGGEGGSANKQAQALANRTEWLKENLTQSGSGILTQEELESIRNLLFDGNELVFPDGSRIGITND